MCVCLCMCVCMCVCVCVCVCTLCKFYRKACWFHQFLLVSLLYFLSHCNCFRYKLHIQEHGEDLKEDSIIFKQFFYPIKSPAENNAKTCELYTSLAKSSKQSGACKRSVASYALLTAYMFVI